MILLNNNTKVSHTLISQYKNCFRNDEYCMDHVFAEVQMAEKRGVQ
jgi:hypothetical protein